MLPPEGGPFQIGALIASQEAIIRQLTKPENHTSRDVCVAALRMAFGKASIYGLFRSYPAHDSVRCGNFAAVAYSRHEKAATPADPDSRAALVRLFAAVFSSITGAACRLGSFAGSPKCYRFLPAITTIMLGLALGSSRTFSMPTTSGSLRAATSAFP